MATADEVLAFWFDELTPEQWFKTFAKVDGAIRTRFGETHDRAVRAELWSWRETGDGPQLAFLFMPFMHSESLAIHDIAGELFSRPGLERNLESQIQHRAVLERFGRYLHRNAVLGRESTAEELAFLEGGARVLTTGEIDQHGKVFLRGPSGPSGLDRRVRRRGFDDRPASARLGRRAGGGQPGQTRCLR